jgi:hypothetical protein
MTFTVEARALQLVAHIHPATEACIYLHLFLSELIQNADDNEYISEKPEFFLKVVEGCYIWTANNEKVSKSMSERCNVLWF